MRRIAASLASVVISITIAGCGDDDAPPSIPDSGPLVDRCLDTGDMTIIEASRMDAGMGIDGGFPNPNLEAYRCTLSATCAPLYLNEELLAAYECVNDCLDSKPSGALSLYCRDCFTLGSVGCAADNCFLDCVGGDQVACTDCFESNCRPALDTCIGY